MTREKHGNEKYPPSLVVELKNAAAQIMAAAALISGSQSATLNEAARAVLTVAADLGESKSHRDV